MLFSTISRYFILRKMPNLKAFPALSRALSRLSEAAVFTCYLYLVMGFFLLNFQSLKKPFHLFERDLFYFVRGSRPLEFHIIQKLFGCKEKSILVIA